MNRIKFLANMFLIPIYFLLCIIIGIRRLLTDSVIETMDAIAESKRKYNIK